MRLESSAEGVVIVDIAEGSPAQSFGFQRGDVVAAVNNEKIERTRDLDRVAKESTRRWSITITRGGQQLSMTFSG